MPTAPNQIVSREAKIFRYSVALADGIKPFKLSYVDSNGTTILPSSFEVQNLGGSSIQVYMPNDITTNYRTVLLNGVYAVDASVGHIAASTGAAATFEVTAYYDRFR